MKRILGMALAAVMLLALAGCGGGDKGMSQKDMADAVVKAALKELGDKGTVYSRDYLVFTPGEDKTSTYVMMGFYYGADGAAVEDTAIGVFNGESMTSFALRETDPDKYGALLDAMPVNNTEEYAKQSLIDEVCKDNGVAASAQAKEDLGI